MIVFNGNKNNCKVPNKKVARAHFEHGPLFYIIEIMPSTANANSIGKS